MVLAGRPGRAEERTEFMDRQHGSGEEGRCLSRVEALVWIVLWLAGLAGLLVYLYTSSVTAWAWVYLLLLALVSPGISAYKKVLGREPGYQGPRSP